MTHLTDMEELLATIKSPLTKDYMREAMNCYMASAYRGCIVLSFIALFDDIYDKLGELGKVNKIAKQIHDDVTQMKNNQDVYETFLIDQLASNNLLPILDTDFLKTLRTLRNKSAHPSGHKPSAEEARFIFFEAINRFLSQPILSTIQLVDDMILRLVNSNFFGQQYRDDIKQIVEEETNLLHEEAYPYLMIKLSEQVVSTDSNVFQNSLWFLYGLAFLDKPTINTQIQKYIIQKKSDDPNYEHVILVLLIANGKLINNLSSACFSRVKRIITNLINNINPSLKNVFYIQPEMVFVSLAKQLNDDELISTLGQQLNLLIEKYSSSPLVIEIFIDHPKAFNLYFLQVLKDAGSFDFRTSNGMVNTIKKIENTLLPLINEQQALELLCAIYIAGINWAVEAKKLNESGYTEISSIKLKAINYFAINSQEANNLISAKLNNDEISISVFLKNLGLENS